MMTHVNVPTLIYKTRRKLSLFNQLFEYSQMHTPRMKTFC